MKKTSLYSEKKLLRAMRENNADGWELFCAQFDPLILCITSWPKWNFSEYEKQDVGQNIYVQLQKALPTFRQECSLSWFIKRIAMRQCVDEIRRQVRWRSVMTSSVQKNSDGDWCEMEFGNENTLDPHLEVLQQERRQALSSTLQQSGDTCRECINLFYLNQLSYREISNKLGIAVNTVGSRLAKCLGKLQKNLLQNPLFEKANS